MAALTDITKVTPSISQSIWVTTASCFEMLPISESAPMGEWVAKGSPVRKAAAQESSSTDSWTSSSFDLLNGAQAVDVTDSVSGDLFDELFVRAAKDTK